MSSKQHYWAQHQHTQQTTAADESSDRLFAGYGFVSYICMFLDKRNTHTKLLVGFKAACMPSSWVHVLGLLQALIWVQRDNVCVRVCVCESACVLSLTLHLMQIICSGL